DGAGERDIEAGFGAVAIHRGEEDLAGAELGHAPRPADRLDAGGIAPAMSKNFPTSGRDLLGVDRDDDALAAEYLRRLAYEIGPRDRRGVDRGLVGAGEQQLANVVDVAHAAADGERHEALLGGAL